jgi:polyribonucleotide nucleotidyltransferase
MKEGDAVDVKVISVDRDGKIRLTRRELLPFPEGVEGDRARERIQQARDAGVPSRSGGGRGDRRDGPPRERSGGPRR